MKRISLFVLAVMAAGLGLSANAAESEENADVSFDGLHKIEKSRFRDAWADPDIDFSRYSKVMPGGAAFQFRAVKEPGSSSTARHDKSGDFWISDADRVKLTEVTSEIFAEELAKSKRFEIVHERGDDVLILQGALLDVVSKVPPDHVGRSEIYLSSVGEATLVIEALDSMSEEVIFRAVERRAAERVGSQPIMSTSVTTWSEVRRLIRRWATTLRKGLDSIPVEE